MGWSDVPSRAVFTRGAVNVKDLRALLKWADMAGRSQVMREGCRCMFDGLKVESVGVLGSTASARCRLEPYLPGVIISSRVSIS